MQGAPGASWSSAEPKRRANRLTLIQWMAVSLVLIAVGRAHELLPGISGNLPLAKVSVVLAFAALFANRKTSRRLRVITSRHGRAFQWYLAATLLSIPFSIYVGNSVFIAKQMLPANIAIAVIIASASRTVGELRIVLRAFVVSMLLTGTAMAAGLGTVIYDHGAARRSVSMMYDPNDLALVAAVTVPFALYLLRDASRTWRTIGWIAIAACVSVIAQTGSRGGFLALVIAAAPAVLGRRSVLPLRLRIAILVAGLCAIPLLPDSFVDRLKTLTELGSDYNSTDPSGRVALAKRGLEHFASRPITGVGLGQFSYADAEWARARGLDQGFKWMVPHNMYLQAGVELGIIGLLGFLALLWMGLRAGARRGLPPPDFPDSAELRLQGVTIRNATLVFAVGGTFLSVAHAPVLMFLAAITCAHHYQRQELRKLARGGTR